MAVIHRNSFIEMKHKFISQNIINIINKYSKTESTYA
jgi:hypothetical protein